jgi:hypothetical protein
VKSLSEEQGLRRGTLAQKRNTRVRKRIYGSGEDYMGYTKKKWNMGKRGVYCVLFKRGIYKA